jgi:hypothetical protein
MLALSLALCGVIAILGRFYGHSCQQNEAYQRELTAKDRALHEAESVASVYRSAYRATLPIRDIRQGEAVEPKTAPMPTFMTSWVND